jgi:acetyl-CoA carboxylase biotin carboxyl carrier protein
VGLVKRRAPKNSRPRAVKSKPAGADNAGGVRPAGFELAELKQLIRLVQRTGIGELEVSSGGRTVRISAHGTTSAVIAGPQAAGAQAPAPVAPDRKPEAADHLKTITSPMVGTFYRAPAPDADPYVEVGTSVEVGQTVCIIEAMKLMNEIESEVKGRIVHILVENAQPVEFGQKLFLVEPV